MNSSSFVDGVEVAAHVIGLAQAETFFRSFGHPGFGRKALLKSYRRHRALRESITGFLENSCVAASAHRLSAPNL
jgi:hypothetical protein